MATVRSRVKHWNQGEICTREQHRINVVENQSQESGIVETESDENRVENEFRWISSTVVDNIIWLSAQTLSMLMYFLLWQEPYPVWAAWDLQVEAGNQERLAQTECMGMRKAIALGNDILTAWLYLT